MKKMICAALLLSSMCLFSSCSDDSAFDKQEEYYETIGVHKIVITTTGDSNINYTASFVGANYEGARELFDVNGESQGEFYLTDGSVDDAQIVCYTDDKATTLALAYAVVASARGEVSYEIDTYINDKFIEKHIDKIIFDGDDVEGKTISITTNKN